VTLNNCLIFKLPLHFELEDLLYYCFMEENVDRIYFRYNKISSNQTAFKILISHFS